VLVSIDVGVVHITKNQTSLQRFVLKKQLHVTSKGLSALKSPALEHLDFSGSSVDSNGMNKCNDNLLC